MSEGTARYTAEEFVTFVQASLFRGAVADAVKELEQGPPGRVPWPRSTNAHEWYRRLGDHDKRMVQEAMYSAVDAALFGILALFDGVRPMVDGFRLEPRVHIHDRDTGEVYEPVESTWGDLHDMFRAFVDDSSGPESWAPEDR